MALGDSRRRTAQVLEDIDRELLADGAVLGDAEILRFREEAEKRRAEKRREIH